MPSDRSRSFKRPTGLSRRASALGEDAIASRTTVGFYLATQVNTEGVQCTASIRSVSSPLARLLSASHHSLLLAPVADERTRSWSLSRCRYSGALPPDLPSHSPTSPQAEATVRGALFQHNKAQSALDPISGSAATQPVPHRLRRSFAVSIVSAIFNTTVMPSYNLPTFPPPPPRPTSRRRPPPPPLNLGPSPFSPSSLTTLAAPTPLSPPSASMRRPFSSAWEPRRNYTRSPLGRSSSPFGARPQPCRPLSRRYVLPPLTTTAAPCQAFTTPLMGRDERGFTMYEEMVWKTLERRIREKVVRSRVGERAGLGVSAGREMLIWASLGSYREAREKVALAMAASMSAPPTRLTFIFPPPTSDRSQGARLARSIGHRKSQSTTGMTIASSAPATRLGGVASRIRGFVARRTTPGVAGESEMKESLAEEAAAMRRIVEDYTDIIKSEFEEDSESEGDSDEEEVMVKIVMVEPERGPPPPPAPAIDISLEDFAAPSQTSSSDQVRSGTPIASSRAPYPDPQAGARPPPVPPRPKTPKRATTAPARLDEKALPTPPSRPLIMPQSPAPAFLRRSSSNSSTSSLYSLSSASTSSSSLSLPLPFTPTGPSPRELYSETPQAPSSPIAISLPPPRYLTGICKLPRPAMPVAIALPHAGVQARRKLAEDGASWPAPKRAATAW